MSQADIIPAGDPSRDEVLEHGRELEIAALKGNPALKVLIAALQESEQSWATRIGLNVLTSAKEVDQRKLDWTRGYYAGARFWLMERVSLAEQRVAAYAAKQEGKTDLRPTGEPDPRVQRSEDA